MIKNLLRNYVDVSGLLALNEPWEYDFKLLKHKELDPVKRFWAYKKSGDGFDCDCCELAMQIQLQIFDAKGYFGRTFKFNGEILETDTLNSFESRYWQATQEERNSHSFKRFAHLTHTLGNFGVGPEGFNFLKGNYQERKRTGDWSNFDRFDSFCKEYDSMREWFYKHRHETIMEMYFEADGSVVSLDNIDIVNKLIIERGKKIVSKLSRKGI
jgi:hypothetical protein